jgi:hypothetical protein
LSDLYQTYRYLALVACPKELSFSATRFRTGGSSFSKPGEIRNRRFPQPSIREVVHESRGRMGVAQPCWRPLIQVHLLTTLTQSTACVANAKERMRIGEFNKSDFKKSNIIAINSINAWAKALKYQQFIDLSVKMLKINSQVNLGTNFHHNPPAHGTRHQLMRLGNSALQRNIDDHFLQ